MANELTARGTDAALITAVEDAASIITKDYLERLERYEIVRPSREDIDTDIVSCGRFYKLTRLVLDKSESFLNKLTTIVNVAYAIDCSMAVIIKSDGSRVEYYFGIVSKNARTNSHEDINRREADAAAFGGALGGNLPGSEIKMLERAEVEQLQASMRGEGKCISSVSGIVALRNENDKSIDGYVQGIENLVDSLKGQAYTLVTIADPVNSAELGTIKQGYEMLYTNLAAFAKSALTLNESDTLTMSRARSEGITDGISEGITLTQTKTNTEGKHSGFNVGGQLGINFGIQAGISFGYNRGKNSSVSQGTSRGETRTTTRSTTHTDTETASAGKTSGSSVQLNFENRTVKGLLDKIDKYLERLDDCSSYGAFDCAAYVIADSRGTALSAASNYNALMRGENSNVQAAHINSWYKPDDTKRLAQYIGALVHPKFRKSAGARIIVTPASVVSGDELAVQIGLPKKSVNGITVIPMEPFGRNTEKSGGRTITLGTLYHMGHDEGTAATVDIDIESLAMHTFVTGSTGAGKSTAIYSLLDKLAACNVKGEDGHIKFMVVEPAKGEYKHRFGYYPDVHVYGTNYKKTPLLRINPFSFPDDIHVLEHIDRMIEIFNVCWPMYAAMPAVLKDAVEEAYIAAGWNLETSECKYNVGGKPLYPTFADVLSKVNTVMDSSAYSADAKGDYKGSLCTRLKSLTNGLYRQIFTSCELSDAELFEENVIVDLSRTGSAETKSLIMGLLVMKLQEYRMASGGINSPLRHITVLEEAHNILKRTSTEQPSEGANLAGKSVEMLSNSIAEMRTYGEGFIIADQAPELMDMSAIRNTNTKIILRLPDCADRELVGRAASLTDKQIPELSRLKTFIAAVYQNNWQEPVLCNIDHKFGETRIYERRDKRQDGCADMIAVYLAEPLNERKSHSREFLNALTEEMFKLNVSAETKANFIRMTETSSKEEYKRLKGKVLYNLYNSETAFAAADAKKPDIAAWYECMRQTLEPSIEALSVTEQQRIITSLEFQRCDTDSSEVATFKSLMKLIKK